MLRIIKTAFFPKTCAACGAVIDDEEYFCDYCNAFLSVPIKDRLCIRCGCKIKDCQCKSRVFYFDGLCAAFYNDTVARKAMYSFKFNRRKEVGLFFAQRMALTVKQSFCDIDFDIVTAVPMSYFAEKRRGYNQSSVLAEKIGKILEIPYYKDILYARHKKTAQHKVSFKNRFRNVENLYYTDKKLNGKTVLLVDDIKTSGATLSECAKQLYKAGADKVYCVTGLITSIKKGNTNGSRNRN